VTAPVHGRHERLYLANATVLLVHQMDAAYWHEWTLFGMPGGLALYLVLNLPIALAVLAGYGALVARRPAAGPFSALLVLAGLFAGVFHAVHLWRGDPAFQAPVSLLLLAATVILSLAQGACLLALRRVTSAAGSRTAASRGARET
jgi:hypothetical protein